MAKFLMPPASSALVGCPFVRTPLLKVLPSAELIEETPGEPHLRRVTVAGTDVLLGRLTGGQVVAFSSTCPHQNTDLQGATFFDGRIRCPLHVYLYDPQTGENIIPATTAHPLNLWKLKPGYLPVYDVEERDGWIWIGAAPKPPPTTYDPERESPPAPGTHRAAPVAPPVAAVDTQTEHPTKTLRVAPGSTFALRLPTTPRPGFTWRVEADGPLLHVVEERFEPGEPARHLVRLAARGVGEATVRCLYARPWDAKPAEIRTYEVRIEL